MRSPTLCGLLRDRWILDMKMFWTAVSPSIQNVWVLFICMIFWLRFGICGRLEDVFHVEILSISSLTRQHMPAWSLCCSRGRYLSCQRWKLDFFLPTTLSFLVSCLFTVQIPRHPEVCTYQSSYSKHPRCSVVSNQTSRLALAEKLATHLGEDFVCLVDTIGAVSLLRVHARVFRFSFVQVLANILLLRSVVADFCWKDLIVL